MMSYVAIILTILFLGYNIDYIIAMFFLGHSNVVYI